jgi:DNA-binding response OmpR family regulator
MRVLVVEDEPDVADLVARALRQATWAVDLATTGSGALERLAVNQYDLAVVDIGLPDIDGLEICRRWRARGGRTPILLLTARGGLQDRVTGLDAGADDYLPKPFALDELLARLRALARRPPVTASLTLSYGGIELDPRNLRATRDGRPIRLSSRELALLEYLLRNPERVLTRGQIIENVWDDNFDPVGNVVDVLVGRLRRKLDEGVAAPIIQTVRGRGYILSTQPEQSD